MEKKSRNINYLKNLANGLLGTFTSRNNDVNGYWGIGKLYAMMINKKIEVIEIDLKSKVIYPEEIEFNSMVSKYSEWIFKRTNYDSFKDLKIILNSVPNFNKPYLLNKVNCKVIFKSENNIEYTLTKNILCRKHNPKAESKRYN